jgi:hypothetical protein
VGNVHHPTYTSTHSTQRPIAGPAAVEPSHYPGRCWSTTRGGHSVWGVRHTPSCGAFSLHTPLKRATRSAKKKRKKGSGAHTTPLPPPLPAHAMPCCAAWGRPSWVASDDQRATSSTVWGGLLSGRMLACPLNMHLPEPLSALMETAWTVQLKQFGTLGWTSLRRWHVGGFSGACFVSQQRMPQTRAQGYCDAERRLADRGSKTRPSRGASEETVRLHISCVDPWTSPRTECMPHLAASLLLDVSYCTAQGPPTAGLECGKYNSPLVILLASQRLLFLYIIA